jgi:hypothetical protein
MLAVAELEQFNNVFDYNDDNKDDDIRCHIFARGGILPVSSLVCGQP